MWLGGYNLRRLARLSELASADTRAREGAPLATQIVTDKTGDTRHEFDLADIPKISSIVLLPALLCAFLLWATIGDTSGGNLNKKRAPCLAVASTAFAVLKEAALRISAGVPARRPSVQTERNWMVVDAIGLLLDLSHIYVVDSSVRTLR